MEGATTILAGVTSIFTSLGSVATFVWGLFGDFLGMILGNALIAVPVLFSVLAGAIAIVYKLIRKFGVKGKH